ncbi:hypothetical protein LOTGIDRAFT_153839 [Lottia gigantea]|uniref:Uncharacterized protein n=1 Tax=Lottia gigantea TaxID=225164 RepID=V4A405_LOTGI|nr:hypothetical protein LOTGIDRAFT_153839 [Lottia gigantea]ESO91402.1 hypothetical protein LOTGIDRAFT_153839 [Lottia gigantea]
MRESEEKGEEKGEEKSEEKGEEKNEERSEEKGERAMKRARKKARKKARKRAKKKARKNARKGARKKARERGKRVIGSELVQKYVEKGARMLRELFEVARAKKACIKWTDYVAVIKDKYGMTSIRPEEYLIYEKRLKSYIFYGALRTKD